jgi:hypothetical protein
VSGNTLAMASGKPVSQGLGKVVCGLV